MLTLTLPVAPSANNAFLNRKAGRGFGRIKSAKYRAWTKQADAFYMLQGMGRFTPITGPYGARMIFPKVRGDLDGRAKLLLDWMVSRKLTPDDKFLRKLDTEIDEGNIGNLVWIKVWSVQDAKG
jgi:hypothetical protein